MSTDIAQDAMEDPIGHANQEKSGFYRLGRGAVLAVRAALSPSTPAKEHA